jgi:carbon monoxide dehydrogenase subunit G
MKIDGSYTFNSSREQLWSFLHDSSAIQRSIPGCEHFHLHADGKYHISLTMPSGPFAGHYEGLVTRDEEQPGKRIHLSITGKGPELVVLGEGVLNLQENHEQTVLIYKGDVEVSGRIPSQFPRLTRTTANFLTRNFLEGLDRQIQEGIGITADNELSAADSAVISRATSTIRMQDFLAEIQRDRNIAVTVLLLALLALLSILGTVFIAVLAVRWLARSYFGHSPRMQGSTRRDDPPVLGV